MAQLNGLLQRVLEAMPALSRFAKTQTVSFCVVAKADESSWRPATIVCRCVTTGAEEFELHMAGSAHGAGAKLMVGSSYHAEIPLAAVKPYRAGDRLGAGSGKGKGSTVDGAGAVKV